MSVSKPPEVDCHTPLLDNKNTLAEKIKIEKVHNNLIKNEMYYIKKSGNHLEVKQYERKPECKIVNVDKDYCYHIKTGEVIKKNKNNNRSQCIESLRRTMNNLRDIINCNVLDNKKCLWITLTYRQDKGIVRDVKKVYKDHKNFWDRCQTYFANNQIRKPKYICVLEPQQSGAWHFHIIWIFDDKAPFIPNETIADLWGNGFTKTQALKDGDNIANYVCSYLCDYAYAKDNSSKKLIIKNARLYLYPIGVRYYRYSRDIKKPEKMIINDKEIYKEYIKGYKKTFESNYNIVSADQVVQRIHKEQYKKEY